MSCLWLLLSTSPTGPGGIQPEAKNPKKPVRATSPRVSLNQRPRGIFGAVDRCYPVQRHDKRQQPNKHILDHLDYSRYLACRRTQHGPGGHHRPGGIDRATHPGHAEDVVHANQFDEQRHGEHHQHREYQGRYEPDIGHTLDRSHG